MTHVAELVETYKKAESRLRGLLFGDGTFSAGYVRGEDARRDVSRELRRMKSAFDAAVFESQQERARKLEARVADLEEELRQIAAARSRGSSRRSED